MACVFRLNPNNFLLDKIDKAISDFARFECQSKPITLIQILARFNYSKYKIKYSLNKLVLRKFLLYNKFTKTWQYNEKWCSLHNNDPNLQKIEKEFHQLWKEGKIKS